MKVILFTLFSFALAEVYHENANSDYKDGTTASTYLFPNYVVANKREPQKFKVYKDTNSEIIFQSVQEENKFFLRTIYGNMKLNRFIVSFNENGVRISIRFSWPNTTPKKVVIVSKVVTPASTKKLQDHAKLNAVSIQPLTLEDVNTLVDQKDTQTKYVTLSAKWIADLIRKKTPLFKPISQSTDLWVFACLPLIMDADTLDKLSQVHQKMEIADLMS